MVAALAPTTGKDVGRRKHTEEKRAALHDVGGKNVVGDKQA
jgi:hypothetical protein